MREGPNWSDFLECADGIQSVTVQAALRDIRVRLHRFQGLPQAQDLRERAGRIGG